MSLMADITDLFKGNVVTGLAIGIGVVVLGPVLMPILAPVVRGVARTAIRGGLGLYNEATRITSEVVKMGNDLIEEARSEEREALAAAGGKPMASAAGRKKSEA